MSKQQKVEPLVKCYTQRKRTEIKVYPVQDLFLHKLKKRSIPSDKV
jgi:hypothetical protein